MRVLAPIVAALILAVAPMSAGAQTLLGAYVAWIGQQDLYNSNGQRLTDFWQIIRQDRANFHRFGIRQSRDEGDPFFADAAARATLEQLVRTSEIDPYSRRMIEAGNVPVYVEIFGSGKAMTSVRVQVPG